jgi:signal peptidase I
MSVDFSLIFVVALAITGLIALVDLALERRRPAAARTEPSWIGAQARALFPIILIVLLVRSFLIEPFRIPSASMMPGLQEGDFIFVNKFTYGLRLPVINTKILSTGEPHRGDVIVFRKPSEPSVDYIKRLIGLPGDHVVVHDNHVTINGQPMPLTPAGAYGGDFGFSGAPLALEHFPASAHLVMFARQRPATDFEDVVPPGRYFFMGDNRNDSADSRFDDLGYVPEQNLIGRAVRIWMNWRRGSVDWSRIGRKIE